MPTLESFSAQTSEGVAQHDISRKRGDDWILRPTFKLKVGRSVGAFDLTGWSFVSLVKDHVDGTILLTGVATLTAKNVVTVLFDHTQTITLDPGTTGVWDLQGTSPDSTIHTLVEGDVLVTGDVS